MPTDGALAFARFAFPPNDLGYCGPDVQDELLQRVAARASGRGLRQLARGFDGAWPYLELIAGSHGLDDPLDARVVEAYWIGNELLHGVPIGTFAGSLHERFGPRLTGTTERDRLTAPLLQGAAPHHGFHVFGVYPWVGLLRSGTVDAALRVLDRCRVRWGRVVAVGDSTATVASRPLQWDGRRLSLGVARQEVAATGRDGYALAGELDHGDWCALHWDWVCQPLSARQLRALRYWTARQLDAVNAAAYPAPAAVLA